MTEWRNQWFALPLNAEPWKSPEVSWGRKNGKLHPEMSKHKGLAVYQASVQDEMERLYPEAKMIDGDVDFTFYYWRNLVVYKGENKTVTKNACDATNVQKALEDALQGILYANDSAVVHAESWLMEQGVSVKPLIVIRVQPCVVRPQMAARVAELRAAWPSVVPADNVHEVTAGVF